MSDINGKERAVTLRILDANANRCAEGLRVVEEIARFDIGDERLMKRLKDIRHSVRRSYDSIAGGGYGNRDSRGDVGKDFSTVSENLRGSLIGIAKANFARSEEALRVMEEFSKLISSEAAGEFKRIRFELYAVEKDFFGNTHGALKLPISPFLYVIIDRRYIAHPAVPSAAEQVLAGGTDLVQYRAKNVGRDEMRSDLLAIVTMAARVPVPVIVNDDPELALEVGADGVHVGAHDAPPGDVRRLLGPNRIIGVSVHTEEELESVPVTDVDYIAVGSVFPSKTKRDVREVGLGFIGIVRGRVDIPIVAIGGIDAANAGRVLDVGADGLAVISAVLEGDIEKNCFTLKEIIDRRRMKMKRSE